MAALLFLTLLYLSTIILSLGENINIDCGASESYVNSSSLRWHGDNDFVTTGESFEIPGNITQPFNNIRYFHSGETNCYTNIPATKGGKTLVRTMFYYGNYDSRSSPPSFNVDYDGNHLVRVVTGASPFISESEVIFAPASENISVCLIRTSPSDVPFISSIEVYSLDAMMYDDLGPNEGLVPRQRFAFGAKAKGMIRYPLDQYGRQWLPLRSNDPKFIELTTSAPLIDITGALNKPPEIVMLNALSVSGLNLAEIDYSIVGKPIYLALYFSEPQSDLGQTQTRSFNVFLDTTQVGSGPIVPVFGKATQVVIRDVATSRSQVVFKSTTNSTTFPPIINALELYLISYGRDGGDNGGGESGGGGGRESGGSNDIYQSGGGGGGESGGGGGRESGGSNDIYSEGRGKKKNKSPLILGVTFVSAIVVTVAAIFSRKRSKPESNTLPTTSTSTSIG